MPGLMDDLMNTLSPGTTNDISRQIGADPGATASAISMALPVLLSALSRNAQAPGGADALHQAIGRDHDGSLLDNLSGFLGNSQNGPGAGILRHVLGDRNPAATQAISRGSGLNAQQVTQLLMMLAPVVLAYLGRQQRKQGLDSGGLSSMLGEAQQQQTQSSPDLMGFATKMLDQNQDGSVLDDMARGLGGIFGKQS